METHNKFFVGVKGDNIVILRSLPTVLESPPGFRYPRTHVITMTHDDALLLAAWIVTCADPGGKKFFELMAQL